MMKTFETFLPIFPGFYNTYLEEFQERQIELATDEEGEYTEETFFEENWDWKKFNLEIAKDFTKKVEEHLQREDPSLEVEIKFQKLNSPKYYNYHNDSIDISLELNLSKLIDLIGYNYEDLQLIIKNEYTSCSGFISSYSNNISDWIIDIINYEDNHKISAIIEMLNGILWGINTEDIVNEMLEENFYQLEKIENDLQNN